MNIDRYGHIGKPEESSHIEVVEDPVQAAISGFKIWSVMAVSEENNIGVAATAIDRTVFDRLYDEACRILAPRAPLFRELNSNQLEQITAFMPESKQSVFHHGNSGLYLSALLNVTELPSMEGVFKQPLLGYRLASGKKLVCEKGSNVYALGLIAEGDLINKGVCEYMFAFCARSGVQINYGNVSEDMGEYAINGVRINLGKVGRKFGEGRGGADLNYGEYDDSLTMMFGKGFIDGYVAKEESPLRKHHPFGDKTEKAWPLLIELQEKVRPLQQLLKDDSADTSKLEDELLLAAKKLEEALK